MSGSKKQPEISFPKYSNPSPTSFSLAGQTAGLNTDTNNYGINYDPQSASDMQMAEGIRRDLLSSFGLNSGSTTQDPYTKAFLDESLRNTQPQLENALIGRGLGGSSVYQGALSDLFSKLGTQATLNSQQYKLNNLNPITDYINNQNTIGQNLLGLANNRDVTNNAAAQQLYETLLPLTAKVNTPSSNNAGLFGSLGGTALALGLAPFTGGASLAFAPIASGVGGSIGGMFDPAGGGNGVSVPNLMSLASLFGGNSSLNLGALQSFGGGTSPFSKPSASQLNSPFNFSYR